MTHWNHKPFAAAAAMVLAFGAVCTPLSGASAVSAATVMPPYSCPAVYDALIAMKDAYPEGMSWTNDDFYAWNGGGTYYGGYGCVAFAYLMSDAAFGTLPCTEYTTFDPTLLRTGDLLREGGHTVVVLEVKTDSVIIAEGNYNSSIHWGREVGFDAFSGSSFEDYTTRYPDEFAFREERLAIDVDGAAEVAVISRDAVDLTWNSSDPAVASVDENGCILGLANGITTITAASDTHTETIEVTVGDPTDPNAVPEGLLYEIDTDAGCVSVTGYEGAASVLEIPAMIEGYPVTQIADWALIGNETVTEIVFPDTLEQIGAYAFYNTALQSIRLPSSLEMIGSYAFFASALNAALLPASVSVIGEGAFSYCTLLTAIAVEPENESFCSVEGVLYDRENSLLVAYPSGKSDASYTIPEGICGIGSAAFNGAYQLTALGIPSTVKYIGTAPFDACPVLEYFTVSAENTAFYDADGVLYSTNGALVAYPVGHERTNYTVENGTVTILESAFSFAENLTAIELPDTLVTIREWAFVNCTGLTAIALPNSVTTIGAYAFSGCTSLSAIIIPPSVTMIGNTAFSQFEPHTIHGFKGSYAETYAVENEIPFVELTYPTGDINMDLSVTIADVILLNRYIAEDPALTPNTAVMDALDCNGDAIVDVNDSVRLLSVLAAL